MCPPGDNDLLFGVTALQLHFVTQEQLVAATAKLAEAPGQTLCEQLCDMKLLMAAEAEAVAAVVERRLARFGNDPRQTLDSIGAEEAAALSMAAKPTDRELTTTCDHFVTQPRAWSYSAQHQRFTVLRLHQQGGLGRLMVARDCELNREIALKEILPAYADNDENRRRFIREAEITGALEHPGVVPVYSLGEFPDGRPYYAMRLIRGVDLRTALDDFHSGEAGRAERRLAFRQLLGRFVDMCHAVDYAHSRGVVHRDLKPANIMLGDFGETLVVDWGLARTLDGHVPSADLDTPPVTPSDRASTDRTQAGRIVGTVPYMSPEQAAGRLDLISRPSDIYGLGATLYHILTGRAPFSSETEDVVLRVEQGRFPPPRRVSKRVPRALEAICLKAMARKPVDRYGTARELANDVERYLADERVEAYAEPWLSRGWRWTRHHRTLVMSLMAAATVAVVALSLSVGMLRLQRDRAERNFQLAQDAVRNYFTRVSQETLLDQPGMQPLRDALLAQALKYYEQFLAERQVDQSLREKVAQAHFYVGQIRETISSPSEALPHYRQAVAVQQRLMDFSGSAQAAADLANTTNALGRALQKLGRRDEAREFFQRAADIREGLAAADPDDAERARELASSIMNLGQLRMAEGDLSGVLPLLERAQHLRLSHLFAGETPDAALQRDLGMGYFNIGQAHRLLSDLAAAESSFLQAAAAFEQLAARQPGDLNNRQRLAACRRMVGQVKAAAGDLEAATEAYERARGELEDLTLRNSNVPEFGADLAGVRMNLAELLDVGGDTPGALEEMLAAVEQLRRVVEEATAVPRYRRDLGVALRAAGQMLIKLDRTEDARKSLEESKRLLEQLVRDHPAEGQYANDLKKSVDALAELDAI